MKRRTLIARIGALFALVLVACQQGITITIADPNATTPTFKLEPSSVFASDGDEITVFWVAELKPVGRPQHDVVWHIESADGTPRHVRQITFGTLPEGFQELRSARPLVAGTTYEVVAASMTGKIGSLMFVSK